MKAIRLRIQKFSRPGVILMATVVAVITSMVVANATQTITTPNAAFISYSLASGTSSAAITPSPNKSVLVMGCNTTIGGVGEVILLYYSGFNWVGFDTGGTIAFQGCSGTLGGCHIMFIDAAKLVEIRVPNSNPANKIQIRNLSVGTSAGNVTLIW